MAGDGGDEMRAVAAIELAGMRRLADELSHAVEEQAKDVSRLRRLRAEYEQLQATLRDLPAKVEHEVMVPLCNGAFMPGRLRHTNEILVLLGDNVFAERSASQAAEMAARRAGRAAEQLGAAERELALLERKHERALHVQRAAEEQASEELVDIREPYEDSDEESGERADVQDAQPRAGHVDSAQPAVPTCVYPAVEAAANVERSGSTPAAPARGADAGAGGGGCGGGGGGDGGGGAAPPPPQRASPSAAVDAADARPLSKFKAERMRARSARS
ncbi:hypothetical protein KFE25_010195 [Diacronema lutheri]|uniref:Uncharacterized protein n=1 Tax=Diacronema lutheri TaxID=2081491 RepID=A0A8J6C7U5_DIALT|nr:hypothetical protein KFE25_010195 [Diacronema lutheri]